MNFRSRFHLSILLAFGLSVCLIPICGQTPLPSARPYLPLDFRAQDQNVQSMLDSAEEACNRGNDEGCEKTLGRALEFTTRENSPTDKALVEDRLGTYFFARGKLREAQAVWARSFSDAGSASNTAIQADVLVALSYSFGQLHG